MAKQVPLDMPPLKLSIPENRGSINSVELNETLLQQWINRLPNNDLVAYVDEYLAALERFNLNRLEPRDRLVLLDIYRKPLNRLVMDLQISQFTNHIKQSVKRDKWLKDFSTLLSLLAEGYKIVVVESLEKESNLKLNQLALFAINRVGEQISYLILQAYKFYRSVPSKAINELHQLYALTLSWGVEDKLPKIAGYASAESSFKAYYVQLLLTSICNPYGLKVGDIIAAYWIMEQLVASVDIAVLPEDKEAVAGHFYINCLSDRAPTASVLYKFDSQSRPPALVMDTKPALVMVDLLFQRSYSSDVMAQQVNIELLKQLVPYLNTSYQREESRTQLEPGQQVFLSLGLEVIHQCIAQANRVASLEESSSKQAWDLVNKTSSGYLVTRKGIASQQELFVGDLVGFFDMNEKKQVMVSRVGFIKWLKTDQHDQTKMGLGLIDGDPISVHIGVQQEEAITQLALFLPEINRTHQPASLIVEKGVVAEGLTLNIKPHRKRFIFTMIADKQLQKGNNFEFYSLLEAAE